MVDETGAAGLEMGGTKFGSLDSGVTEDTCSLMGRSVVVEGREFWEFDPIKGTWWLLTSVFIDGRIFWIWGGEMRGTLSSSFVWVRRASFGIIK
jgi:hypothetical protein